MVEEFEEGKDDGQSCPEDSPALPSRLARKSVHRPYDETSSSVHVMPILSEHLKTSSPSVNEYLESMCFLNWKKDYLKYIQIFKFKSYLK